MDYFETLARLNSIQILFFVAVSMEWPLSNWMPRILSSMRIWREFIWSNLMGMLLRGRI